MLEERGGLSARGAALASAVAGVLFATGWLLWVDAVAAANYEYGFIVDNGWWAPGVLQTISLVMVNVINWNLVSDPDFESATAIRAWVFVSFVCAFSGIIASLWILIGENDAVAKRPAWRQLEQGALIFLSSLLFRASRTSTDDV